MSKVLGQPVVVENIAGTASILGVSYVAHSDPDGYTMLIASASIVIVPALRNDIPYDVEKDLTPVSQINTSSHVLVVNGNDTRAKTLPDLVAMLKEKPDFYNYASSGIGSTPHLMAELFMTYTGTKMTHIPFKSSGESGLALLRGEAEAVFDAMPAVLPMIQQGSLRALAVGGATRAPELPDVPTMKEVYPDFPASDLWLGIFVRSGTPQPIIDKMNKAIHEAVHSPEGVRRLAATGSRPVGSSQADFVQHVNEERKVWDTLIKSKGIKAE
jgi:tripartite-type tricarboxylate transporter receptor subunit TctC